MDNRINIAVIVGVVLTLAFAVTFTQTDNQGISQDEQESPLAKPDVYSETPGKPVDAVIVDIPFTDSFNPNTREVVKG